MCSILADLEDLVEDFSDLEEEFLLDAPVTDWVERDWPESSLQQPSLSQHREEQEALRRRVRRRRSNSFSNDSWKEVESSASSGVRLRTDLYAGDRAESPQEEDVLPFISAQTLVRPISLTTSWRRLIVSIFSLCLLSYLALNSADSLAMIFSS